jgi:transcriptional regulator with PAS, ATPase and Fis domain
MREVLNQAQSFSQDRQVPVLIQGESGTGKDLIARLIHHFNRPNSLDPFVALNCSAISQELFESELFGYESGSFTGATPRGRVGKLEAANGGTIFLDEIGEMPFIFQVKLLRALDDKKIYRIGGNKEIPLDVRIISATNKDLQHEVEQKAFRLDLYYRINTGIINVPPLRRRSEDILPLASYFIKRAFTRKGLKFEGFTSEAERFLLTHMWPGNVRQLKNTMERLAIMPPPGKVDIHDLHFVDNLDTLDDSQFCSFRVLGENNFVLPDKKLDLQSLEFSIIKMALEKQGGNKSKTADYLGISRKMLYGKLKKIKS